mgnify:CR=1 FL=1
MGSTGATGGESCVVVLALEGPECTVHRHTHTRVLAPCGPCRMQVQNRKRKKRRKDDAPCRTEPRAEGRINREPTRPNAVRAPLNDSMFPPPLSLSCALGFFFSSCADLRMFHVLCFLCVAVVQTPQIVTVLSVLLWLLSVFSHTIITVVPDVVVVVVVCEVQKLLHSQVQCV